MKIFDELWLDKYGLSFQSNHFFIRIFLLVLDFTFVLFLVDVDVVILVEGSPHSVLLTNQELGDHEPHKSTVFAFRLLTHAWKYA